MLFDDGFQATDQGVERIVGIVFLGPEGIADLCFRELMRLAAEEHFHELLLHGGKPYLQTFRIIEPTFSLRIGQAAECYKRHLLTIMPKTVETPKQRRCPQDGCWPLV